jgi:hypothetical protein
MSAPEDRGRMLDLIHRFLEKELSSEELRELESLLRDHDGARRELVLAAALHQELFVLHEVADRSAALGLGPGLDEAGEAPGRRPPTLRNSRRLSSRLREVSWVPAIAAAAFLIVAILLALMFGSDSRSSGSGHRDSARRPETTLPKVPPAAGPGSEASQEPAGEKAQEERIRAESSRRLADLERRRTELAQRVPQEPDPKRAEQQKADLGLLEEEKRKIEEEMKSAIEQARRMHPERSATTRAADSAVSPAEKSPPGKASPLASVERVEGDGVLVRKDSRSPVREGTEILTGDGLETAGATGRVVLRFGDRSRVELRGDTSISEISEDATPGAARGKQILLARGVLSADVTKQPAGRPLVLKTPHSEATVLGTSFRLLVDPGDKGATRLEVHEGKIHFARQIEKKASVDVSGGHYAVAAPGIALLSRPILQPRTGTPEKPALSGLAIVSADTGRPLIQFDPLEDGTVITLADLSTRALNIQASTSPATVGSVLFSWDGNPVMEGRAPYFLAGNDTRGKPMAWTPAPGEHTLTVTPYSGPPAANKREGTGAAGTAVTVRLLVR